VPLPPRVVAGADSALFAFFGRDLELERIAAGLKEAAVDRRPRVVLIGGEPGVGKTALAAHAARAAHAIGAGVLFGACEEDLTVPYRPWITALSHLVTSTSSDVLSELSDVHVASLARLLPTHARLTADDAVPGDADTERFVLFEAVVGLLGAVSERAPLVVVLDDLHWSDAATIQLLRHVIGADIPLHVTILVTYRHSDLTRGHPLTGLLAELRREPRAQRIDLDGLADAEIIELMQAAAGYALDDNGVALAHAIRRETDGNPFFVTELLRHLWESGFLRDVGAGRYELDAELNDLDLPGSVRDVVGQRVARLGDDVERVLRFAAVVGRDFDVDVLARVADVDEDPLLNLLEVAAAAGLIAEVDGGRFRFVHALIRNTLYRDQGATRRQRTHQRVAQVLEELYADDAERAAEIANHWIASTRPTHASKALEYAVRAGDAAQEALAPMDASRWYEQALELLDATADADGAARCRILLALTEAQRNAGDPAHYDTLREASRLARRLGDTDLLVDAALSRMPGLETVMAADPDRQSTIEAALAAVGTADSDVRARLLASLSEEIDPREAARADAYAREAIEVAQRVGDDRTFVDVVCLAFNAIVQPDGAAERATLTATIVDLADRVGNARSRVQARQYAAAAATAVGDMRAAARYTDELSSMASDLGVPFLRWVALMAQAQLATLHCDLDAAEALVEEALDLGARARLSSALTTYGGQIYFIRMYQGRLEELVDLLRQVVDESPTLPVMRAARLRTYCELGRFGEATELLRREVAANFADFSRDMSWLDAMLQFADSAVDLGQLDAVAMLHDLLLPYAAAIASNPATVEGAIARPLGRLCGALERYDEGERHLATALAVHEAWSAPYLVARTQLDWAELCLARNAPGDTERAVRLVVGARTLAERHGLLGLQRRGERMATLQ
jgi:tetratricopeptide (TPR) repeat protein